MKKISDLIRENKKVIVYFHNDSCGHCKQLKPKVNLLEAKNKDSFFYVDTHEKVKLTEKFKVEYVPTLIIIEGKNITKLEGFNQIKELYETTTNTETDTIRD
jgi:thioredoxin 1